MEMQENISRRENTEFVDGKVQNVQNDVDKNKEQLVNIEKLRKLKGI